MQKAETMAANARHKMCMYALNILLVYVQCIVRRLDSIFAGFQPHNTFTCMCIHTCAGHIPTCTYTGRASLTNAFGQEIRTWTKINLIRGTSLLVALSSSHIM